MIIMPRLISSSQHLVKWYNSYPDTRGGSAHAGLNQISCNMHQVCGRENVAKLWIVNPAPNCKLTESNPTNSTERLMQQFCGILSLLCYLLNSKSPGITAQLWEENQITFSMRTVFNHWPLDLKKIEGDIPSSHSNEPVMESHA